MSTVGPATLATTFDPKRNSLNALRVALAVIVIVSHAWPSGGFGADPKLGGEGAGRWAVAGFFALSGFLVTDSRLRLGLGGYLVRRAARILPGFWVCLFVTAFLAAPLVAALTGTGWEPLAALRYVLANLALVIVEPTVGGTLAMQPYPRAFNDSLWTLKWEFLAYLGVGVALGVPALRRRPGLFVAALPVLVLGHLAARLTGFGSAAVLDAFWLASAFTAGVVAHLYRDRIRMDGRIALVAVVVVAVAVATRTLSVFGPLPVAYLMLWLAVRLPLHRWFRRHDISYGLYVYGFVVQHCLAAAGMARFGVAAMAVLSVAGTVPIAWASWLAVERPARDAVRRALHRHAGRRSPAHRRRPAVMPILETR